MFSRHMSAGSSRQRSPATFLIRDVDSSSSELVEVIAVQIVSSELSGVLLGRQIDPLIVILLQLP